MVVRAIIELIKLRRTATCSCSASFLALGLAYWPMGHITAEREFRAEIALAVLLMLVLTPPVLRRAKTSPPTASSTSRLPGPHRSSPSSSSAIGVSFIFMNIGLFWRGANARFYFPRPDLRHQPHRRHRPSGSPGKEREWSIGRGPCRP